MDHSTNSAHGGPGLYGVMAEYRSPSDLIAAAEKAHEAGYRTMDAYSPFPIEELSEVICEHRPSKVAAICLIGGIAGAFSGWFVAWWTSAINYPLNIGGKPFNSWPAFIPVIFECTILFAAFSAGIGMLVLNRLPQPYHPVFNLASCLASVSLSRLPSQPYHPVFNIDSFREKVSREGYFLCIEATDGRYDHGATREFLASTGAVEVHDVEP